MTRSRKSLLIGGVSMFAFAAAVYAAAPGRSSDPLSVLEPATPPGITMQPIGKAQGHGLDKESSTLLVRDRIAFADAHGMTLYTYKLDTNGKSVCVEECAKTWPPAVAPADAKPMGPWSVVTRVDGTRQWALRGKPLYTYVKDEDIGSIGGNAAKRYGDRGNPGDADSTYFKQKPKDEPLPENWEAALIFPVGWVKTPAGISVKEVEDVAGLVLVNDFGHTAYYFDGDPNKESKTCGAVLCVQMWSPMTAPLLAAPVGDFGFVLRDDGIRQWTYKGKALYTYSGDLAPNDANGEGVDKAWSIAYVARYFMPPSVSIQKTSGLGNILTTSQGQTLYRREAYMFQAGSGHGLRRGIPLRPVVGRDIGTDPRCSTDCTKEWHPLLAPADAKPQGYWDVATREDGARQWTYRGYALWTYAGDTKPGDMKGNDKYDIKITDRVERPVNIGTEYRGAPALYWSTMIP